MVVMPCSLLGAYCTGTYKQLTSSIIRLEDFSKQLVPARPDGITSENIIKNYMLLKLCFAASVPSYLSHSIFLLSPEDSHIHIP
jgi:hypothetical protein